MSIKKPSRIFNLHKILNLLLKSMVEWGVIPAGEYFRKQFWPFKSENSPGTWLYQSSRVNNKISQPPKYVFQNDAFESNRVENEPYWYHNSRKSPTDKNRYTFKVVLWKRKKFHVVIPPIHPGSDVKKWVNDNLGQRQTSLSRWR